MNVRSCLWPTIRDKAACGGVAPSGPDRNIWTVRSETERSTERERERAREWERVRAREREFQLSKKHLWPAPLCRCYLSIILWYQGPNACRASSCVSPCVPGCGWWRRSLSLVPPAALCVSSPSCRAWRRSEASSPPGDCEGRETDKTHRMRERERESLSRTVISTVMLLWHVFFVKHMKLTHWRHCRGNRRVSWSGRPPVLDRMNW